MGALGALITLTPRVLYPVHRQTTQDWSLTALEDQQLGGLIMWVPGCTAIVIALLAILAEFLSRGAQEPSTPEVRGAG
jgi:putative membrane protein